MFFIVNELVVWKIQGYEKGTRNFGMETKKRGTSKNFSLYYIIITPCTLSIHFVSKLL